MITVIIVPGLVNRTPVIYRCRDGPRSSNGHIRRLPLLVAWVRDPGWHRHQPSARSAPLCTTKSFVRCATGVLDILRSYWKFTLDVFHRTTSAKTTSRGGPLIKHYQLTLTRARFEPMPIVFGALKCRISHLCLILPNFKDQMGHFYSTRPGEEENSWWI